MTTEDTYILIPQNIVTQYDEKLYSNPNEFNAVQTTDGRWVCSINSLHEFTSIFEGVEVTVLQLAVTDFPKVIRSNI